MTTEQTTTEMTTEQATNEALLRMIRRLRRTQPAAFGEVWCFLSEDVRDALHKAETAADKLRDTHKPTPEGLTGLDWPAEPDYGDEE